MVDGGGDGGAVDRDVHHAEVGRDEAVHRVDATDAGFRVRGPHQVADLNVLDGDLQAVASQESDVGAEVIGCAAGMALSRTGPSCCRAQVFPFRGRRLPNPL